MINFKLSTPVAFIIFNRPDTTERVFAEIARAKPPKLLVVADGPRSERQGEADNCTQARSIINRVDWDCEVLTNFSETNLGCKVRVSTGIDWVFQQVEEAIILEDDCLPDQSFFRFCEEMLEHYRDDQRIGMISGDNFQFGIKRNNDSYYFSSYVHIWGWGTWRDRWQNNYDVNISKWPQIKQEGWLFDILSTKKEVAAWTNIFDRTHGGLIDTWDYQWVFANWIEGRINIMPNCNLISNIGFGSDATHTVNFSHLANIPTTPIIFPIKHPLGKIRNLKADRFTTSNQSISKRIVERLRRRFS